MSWLLLHASVPEGLFVCYFCNRTTGALYMARNVYSGICTTIFYVLVYGLCTDFYNFHIPGHRMLRNACALTYTKYRCIIHGDKCIFWHLNVYSGIFTTFLYLLVYRLCTDFYNFQIPGHRMLRSACARAQCIMLVHGEECIFWHLHDVFLRFSLQIMH
jgi:hypothetical protein